MGHKQIKILLSIIFEINNNLSYTNFLQTSSIYLSKELVYFIVKLYI